MGVLVSVVFDAEFGNVNGGILVDVDAVLLNPGGAIVVALLVVGEGGRKSSLSRSGSGVLGSTVRLPNWFSSDVA